MAKSYLDVAHIVDAYKKDGHKVSGINREKDDHFSFKRTAPDGRTFVHSFTPRGTKLETGPMETPHGVDDGDEIRSDAVKTKRGRGRPKGSASGAR